jgi:hypothetical protein
MKISPGQPTRVRVSLLAEEAAHTMPTNTPSPAPKIYGGTGQSMVRVCLMMQQALAGGVGELAAACVRNDTHDRKLLVPLVEATLGGLHGD